MLVSAQYHWKKEKDKNGIQVYTSDVDHLDFDAVKVECSFNGDYEKLIAFLTDVENMDTWVYNAKNLKLMKSYSPMDFIYYMETTLPWPVIDRYALIHFKFNCDSLPKFMTITGIGEPYPIPFETDYLRLDYISATWMVTMPAENTLHIEYILEIDPGGGMPGWIGNMFIVKGPFETFNNLSHKMKE